MQHTCWWPEAPCRGFRLCLCGFEGTPKGQPQFWGPNPPQKRTHLGLLVETQGPGFRRKPCEGKIPDMWTFRCFIDLVLPKAGGSTRYAFVQGKQYVRLCIELHGSHLFQNLQASLQEIGPKPHQTDVSCDVSCSLYDCWTLTFQIDLM